MARQVVRPKIVKLLMEFEGQLITIEDIMDALPAEAQTATVRSVMRKLMEDGEMDITAVAAGHTWRIGSIRTKPKAKAEDEKLRLMVGPLEVLGKMEDGSQLVRDNANGKLFTLRAL
jgi:hypothetical protein